MNAVTRHPVRSTASWILVVLATLLVPLSVVVSWTAVRLVDESSFVDTFAPIAGDEDVQAALIDAGANAVESSVDIDGLTDSALDQLSGLGLPSSVDGAIKLLRGTAADGVRAIVERTITDFVHSDAFPGIFETALRLSHRTLVATADGVAFDGALRVGENATLDLEVGPMIAQVRQRLIDQGYGFAEAIPDVDASITLVQSDVLPAVATAYKITTAAGWWLPLGALALFVLSVLIAPRRARAVVRAGIGLVIGAGLVLVALAVGDSLAGSIQGDDGVTAAAVSAIFTQIVSAVRTTSWVLLVLGVIAAVAGWASGRRRSAPEIAQDPTPTR